MKLRFASSKQRNIPEAPRNKNSYIQMKNVKLFLAVTVGTFILAFAGGGAKTLSVTSNGEVNHIGVALTFGLAITVIVYAIGKISGANVDPAISIALTLT